ncbi:DNA gyrase subunit A [Synechococcus sp. PCC 7336]|uniref:DNA gyrase subunit A n=1 Tax=Synechococcus sp. PCC 7336 TaxID=195250 RepID=UPI000345BBFD|nr:DNA gyrase subunit A [Synechococcus sp. PCC 7336]
MTDATFEGVAGQILPISLLEEMERSYLEYAMSVIVGRALPDVRDGLKPVHRRILFAMHELGLTPDRPFRKCARVVGDVLGKYHPHGDQAVYDALVRMVQDFSSRYPLLQGHGNFGSVDADPPAAMRYTETRLSPISSTGVLDNINEGIVPFASNFDGSQQEPVVLPAQLPILLLNGADGIAVGMATKIPPHNLGELVDGLLAAIDRPDITVEGLMNYIPAPDFPTGGEIVGNTGLLEVYTKGRGSIPLRGIAHVEEIQPGKGRHRRDAIVITEFPYQVNKAAWIEKVADLTNQGRLEGISDLRDESDRTGIRVVVELRKDARPEIVLAHLYRSTQLQINYGAILLALVNREPKQLSLKEALQEFLDFRIETLTNVLQQELGKYRKRSEELGAQLLALQFLDETIELLRNAPDGPTAKVQLQELLDCTANQADTILAMPLRRLTGLERNRIASEQEEVTAKIEELETLLGDRKAFLKHLKKELRSLKKQFSNQRRTRIVSEAPPQLEEADLIPNQAVVLQITQKGYVRRLLPAAFERHAKARKGIQEEVEDYIIQAQATELHQDFLALTASGRMFSVKVHEIPATSGRSRGTALVNVLSTKEEIVATFALAEYPEDSSLTLLTQKGRMKRVMLSEFANLTARGLSALKVKDDDAVGWAILTELSPDSSVAIATSAGRVLRLPLNVEQVPVMGRTALGNQALRLRRKEAIVGMAIVQPSDRLVFVSAKGYAKRIPARAIRMAKRGSVGMQAMQFKLKSDTLVGMVAAAEDVTMGWVTNKARVLRLSVGDVPESDRASVGTRMLSTAAGESIELVNLVSPEAY